MTCTKPTVRPEMVPSLDREDSSLIRMPLGAPCVCSIEEFSGAEKEKRIKTSPDIWDPENPTDALSKDSSSASTLSVKNH